VSAEGTTVWERTAAVLKEQLNESVWSSTFQDIQVAALHDDVLTLSVPSQLVRQRIEQRYFSLIEAALADAGYPDVRLILEVEIDDRRPEPGDELTVDLTTSADGSWRTERRSTPTPSPGGRPVRGATRSTPS
jgi:chromosomal replication initiation ATPase DnaA